MKMTLSDDDLTHRSEESDETHLPDDAFFASILFEGMTSKDRSRVKQIYVDEIVTRYEQETSPSKRVTAAQKAQIKIDIIKKARLYAFDEAQRIKTHQVVRRKISDNDPTFIVLQIGPEEDPLELVNFPTRDWVQFGKDIGKNTHIRDLQVQLFGEVNAFHVDNEHEEEVEEEEDDVTKEDMRQFFQGVSKNRSIEKLSFKHFHLFSKECFRILGEFFKTNKKLKSLSISYCMLGDTHIDLATALAGFDSLTEFELYHRHENLPWEDMNDEKAAVIIQALSGHSRLRKLSLSGNQIGTGGCAALATSGLMQNPNSRLMELDLNDNPINDPEHLDADLGAKFLASMMLGNTSLTRLNLSCTDIRTNGWIAIIAMLRSRNCRLEHLSLSTNQFDDATFKSLSDVLSNKLTLKTLELRKCNGVSEAGLRAISSILQNRAMKLVKLDLTGNAQVNDNVAAAFAKSLTKNTSLKSLILDDNNITSEGWAAFSQALCNKASYKETYNSNHTVQEIRFHDELPEDLEMLLECNRKNSVSQAAKKKIVQNFLRSVKMCGN
mmetsp:Transcript_10063/g.18411  ORF Transcript_10063/g.18411 Transcript_10063/m.18411 type:complete len:552 (-) Transcript_10063:40-1695(-)